MSKRNLAHLDLTTVLVTANISTWKTAPNGDTAVCLTNVDLADYATGKTKLAETQDHCWVWIPPNLWDLVWEMSLATGEQMILRDRVYMVATVGPYMRSDQTTDWGLRPRNQFPVSVEQSRKLRRVHQRLYRQNIPIPDLAGQTAAQLVYLYELEREAADWRELGISLKDAMVNVRRNIAALRKSFGRLDDPDRVLPATFEQIDERIRNAER